jgi:hypothetical protein
LVCLGPAEDIVTSIALKKSKVDRVIGGIKLDPETVILKHTVNMPKYLEVLREHSSSNRGDGDDDEDEDDNGDGVGLDGSDLFDNSRNLGNLNSLNILERESPQSHDSPDSPISLSPSEMASVC